MLRIAKTKNPQPNSVASLDFNKAKLWIAADSTGTQESFARTKCHCWQLQAHRC